MSRTKSGASPGASPVQEPGPNWFGNKRYDFKSTMRSSLASRPKGALSGRTQTLPEAFWTLRKTKYFPSGVHVPQHSAGGLFHPGRISCRPVPSRRASQREEKDVKTIQGLLRHVKASTTLDLYSQTIEASKLEAQKDIALAITSNQVEAN